MEAWLASLEPRIIDAWLAYAKVEPEAFTGPRPSGNGQAGGRQGKWVSANEAVGMLAQRFGK